MRERERERERKGERERERAREREREREREWLSPLFISNTYEKEGAGAEGGERRKREG